MQDEQHEKLSKLIDNLYDVIDQRKEQAEAHLELVTNSTEIDTSLEDILRYNQQLGNQETKIQKKVEQIQLTMEKSLASLNLLIERHFTNEIKTVASFEREARACIQSGIAIDRNIVHQRVYSSSTKCDSERRLESLLSIYSSRGKVKLDQDEVSDLVAELNSKSEIIDLAKGDWRILLFAASHISDESKAKLLQRAEINEFGTTTKKLNKETWMSVMSTDTLAARIGRSMNTNGELHLASITKILDKV